MSVKVAALVWEMRGCSPIQKLILLKLADHASDDGRNIHPKQKTIAADCECGVRSVQRVVQWACDVGVLEEIPGPGNRPKTYKFNLDAVRQRVTLTVSHPDCETSSVRHTDVVSTPHRRAIKKEPSTNHQLTISGIPFSSPAFTKSWEDWTQFRKEKKQSLTPTTTKKQFAQLGKFSEPEAIAMLEQSMVNGWTGLFPIKDTHLRVEKGGIDEGADFAEQFK